ncbi:MAG: MOSC domain-containing protein [Armatimonadetes bacterium]|nr:MOSC domain-containing protein [Armatimonadota bacterium]
MEAIVSGLFVYPIKGCRAIAVESAPVEARGLRNDRRWMLVHAETGGFLSQRSHSEMARIHVTVTEGDTLGVVFGRELVVVPFVPDAELERITATIWGFTGDALDCGEEAASFFTDLLRLPLRLVRVPDDFARRVSPRFARTPTDGTGFADGFPVLLTTEPSLSDLNTRLPVPVPMNRFRPNVVVSGDFAPWAEGGWETLRIGNVVLHHMKPCERCGVTTIEQETGAHTGAEPLATLATFRRDAVSGKVLFGANLTPEPCEICPVIRVGDALTVA